MKEKSDRSRGIKIIITIIFMAFFVVLVVNGTNILRNSTDIYVISNGSLLYEEPAEGYIIRDETILQGENYKNGMVQIVPDGERAAKSQAIFRYYSNSEQNILNQITEIDLEINKYIEENNLNIISTDIVSLENQIEQTINSMYNVNYIQKIGESKNKIESCISKKTQMTGVASPDNSYVKTLTDQRINLERELEKGSETVAAPISGLASYRVDGLEDVLKVGDFSYLSKELLDSFDLKVGASIPLNGEKGKIVNNFESYIAIPINTEKAFGANVGDKVTLRLLTLTEVDAEICYIKDEEKDRIIVFKIEDDVSELLEYRKISLDIIWWKYTGLKVSNSALIEEDDKMYVERQRAGLPEKILVKVLRQNDTYSIIENYDDEELVNMGYSEEEIDGMSKIKLYDEILLH